MIIIYGCNLTVTFIVKNLKMFMIYELSLWQWQLFEWRITFRSIILNIDLLRLMWSLSYYKHKTDCLYNYYLTLAWSCWMNWPINTEYLHRTFVFILTNNYCFFTPIPFNVYIVYPVLHVALRQLLCMSLFSL